ncbi:hypothetical protein [Meiothermus sp. Pnk-1]|uniref:hypothetical protein n=2 Tax=unclassified Meiothermus TaxID=370471 RepID=UPI000D7D0B3E|nr:hypothetical protein [Meiothermus sp. Pnk-1]PZA06911.1 hypothetical protein DNA98_09535 [Meiothermus sp. Pnk-1]RYM38306.1 hypothetical protein EWH23_04660 [Meiothermus sp. PNK-Is4]
MTAAPTDAERLLELLLEPCCPICTLSRQAVLSYLDEQLVRSGVSGLPSPQGDRLPGVRAVARPQGDRPRQAFPIPTELATGVLCSRHWRKLVMLEVRRGARVRLSEALLGELLEGADAPRPCPACEVQQAAARHYLGMLSRLPTETLELALRQGEGFVCLRHLAALPTGPLKGWLLERVHTLTLDLPRFQQRYARHHGTYAGEHAAGDMSASPKEDPQAALAALAALEGEGWLA